MTRTACIAAALFALTLFCVREIRVLHGTGMLHILDVGQGSAALLVTPSGRTVLFDGGPDTLVLPRMAEHLSFFRRSIDLVVLSHADTDHSGGLGEVFRRYRVGRVLLNGETRHTPAYDDLLREIRQQKIPVLLPDPGTDIVFGDGVTLDIVWPPEPAYATDRESNAASVTVRILCGGYGVLLPGDIDVRAEAEILARGAEVRADVLAAAHHGSKTSSSTGFLLAVQPSLVAISAGRDNQFGHPHPVVLSRLHTLGIPNRVTAEAGTLSFTVCGV